MRLQLDAMPDGGTRFRSPDVPGMVRMARGMDATWRVLREFQQALKGVDAGEWQITTEGVLDGLLADAEQATSGATRTQAKRVRASVERLQQTIEDNRQAEQEAQRVAQARADALADLARAEAALARAREAARAVGAKGKSNAKARGTGRPSGRPLAASTIERRDRIREVLARGITRPSDIGRELGIESKTVSNDLRRINVPPAA